MDRSAKQKTNKETQTLNDTINQLDLIDIYGTFHSKRMNFTFFSSAHGTFSRIDHILGHKSSLSKFKRIEIIPSIFSDHNAVRLDLSYRRKTIKNFIIWRLNNTLLCVCVCVCVCVCLNFYFYFILLYNTVLVLPYIDMNPLRVYMRSQT